MEELLTTHLEDLFVQSADFKPSVSIRQRESPSSTPCRPWQVAATQDPQGDTAMCCTPPHAGRDRSFLWGEQEGVKWWVGMGGVNTEVMTVCYVHLTTLTLYGVRCLPDCPGGGMPQRLLCCLRQSQ